MKTDHPIPVRRADYRSAPYRISRTELEFHLDETATRVHAALHVERQGDTGGPLVLDGEHLKLIDIKLDGRPLAGDFDVKKSGPAVMPSAAALASNERALNEESQRDRRNTARVSLQR